MSTKRVMGSGDPPGVTTFVNMSSKKRYKELQTPEALFSPMEASLIGQSKNEKRQITGTNWLQTIDLLFCNISAQYSRSLKHVI